MENKVKKDLARSSIEQMQGFNNKLLEMEQQRQKLLASNQ